MGRRSKTFDPPSLPASSGLIEPRKVLLVIMHLPVTTSGSLPLMTLASLSLTSLCNDTGICGNIHKAVLLVFLCLFMKMQKAEVMLRRH